MLLLCLLFVIDVVVSCGYCVLMFVVIVVVVVRYRCLLLLLFLLSSFVTDV